MEKFTKLKDLFFFNAAVRHLMMGQVLTHYNTTVILMNCVHLFVHIVVTEL